MAKNKLAKFADMEQFHRVLQYPFAELSKEGFPYKGKWHKEIFHNDNPIVLELGCGKGEYTVGLARQFKNKNFIGIDIKGARMWTGAKIINEDNILNAAFLRTDIGLLGHFFAENEVSEIWITFPDPQMKKVNKRLTSTRFLNAYSKFTVPQAIVHLKTDSPFLYTYTEAMAKENHLEILHNTADLYGFHNDLDVSDILSIRTYYEQQWLDRGLDIKYLAFRLPKEYTWIEPDIEIEPDSYRSFNRSRRSQSR
ncbi:MAG: tRNA (guanosine(46)-N7)-methyltransferase TrmB [Porphyromonadaceae bacterium]|nr:tRNA (guanosine(46)-N7)-methyltransferase TrmB [Porphyromonadaceae bacterium]